MLGFQCNLLNHKINTFLELGIKNAVINPSNRYIIKLSPAMLPNGKLEIRYYLKVTVQLSLLLFPKMLLSRYFSRTHSSRQCSNTVKSNYASVSQFLHSTKLRYACKISLSDVACQTKQLLLHLINLMIT